MRCGQVDQCCSNDSRWILWGIRDVECQLRLLGGEFLLQVRMKFRTGDSDDIEMKETRFSMRT